MPAFFKKEKLEKFFRQWEARKGLEHLKLKHALQIRANGTDREQYKRMKAEIENYLSEAFEQEK